MSKYLNRQAATDEQAEATACERCQALEQENAVLGRLLEKYVLKAAALKMQVDDLQKALSVFSQDEAGAA